MLVVVIGLSSILGEGTAASARPGYKPAARQRHRARLGAGHVVAHRREPKRSRLRGPRHPKRAAPAQPEPIEPPVALVTLTTAAKGTSFYVDSRRVGTGSTVHQSLPPGAHHVQAVHPSGARWQKYLTFEAGDDRKLIIHW